MDRQCNLTKRIQTNKGLRYLPAVLSANGRIRPDVVLVEDREERHPEGASRQRSSGLAIENGAGRDLSARVNREQRQNARENEDKKETAESHKRVSGYFNALGHGLLSSQISVD